MKLLLVCYSDIAMDTGLPEREPLGGSESAIAYLARHLAANGHDVSMAARLTPGMPERMHGVRHLPLAALDQGLLADDCDAVIALSAPAAAELLRRRFPRALHVAWLHLLPGDKAMAPLGAAARFIDWAVFVSRSQQTMFGYPLPSAVIGNGIAPAFNNLFASADALHAAKENRAAYTSMPYRGLHLLLEVIARMRSGTRFEIYSAMHTYRKAEVRFQPLYDQAKSAPLTRYHGVLPQPQLAQALKPVAFLSYPCAFLETYCISALEAIAAGMKVVSLAIGALPETTLGFADLLPVADENDAELVTAYSDLLEKNVAAFERDPESWAAERFAQSQTVNRLCSWGARAREWEEFLQSALATRRG
jgi:glycosyltransferase involved in cell wall biosynthesis